MGDFNFNCVLWRITICAFGGGPPAGILASLAAIGSRGGDSGEARNRACEPLKPRARHHVIRVAGTSRCSLSHDVTPRDGTGAVAKVMRDRGLRPWGHSPAASSDPSTADTTAKAVVRPTRPEPAFGPNRARSRCSIGGRGHCHGHTRAGSGRTQARRDIGGRCRRIQSAHGHR